MPVVAIDTSWLPVALFQQPAIRIAPWWSGSHAVVQPVIPQKLKPPAVATVPLKYSEP